jgi:hypothetical protein
MDNNYSFKRTNFLDILKVHNPKPNAFILFNYSNTNPLSLVYNFFGPNEDLYDFEIRCPICLGRVSSACRPNSCFHVYCSPCLKRYKNYSNNCPTCRRTFNSIIKVYYSEPWVKLFYS